MGGGGGGVEFEHEGRSLASADPNDHASRSNSTFRDGGLEI